MISSLMSGNFDDSDVGRQLAAWFAERPQRVTQRQVFVDLLVQGLRSKPESVAMRLMDCIMKSWGGEQFGHLLAQKLDEAITFDPPKDQAQVEHQRRARSMMDGYKQQLRALDT